MKKPSPLQILSNAMQVCATAHGKVNWTNGYRTGNPKEEDKLLEREISEWRHVDRVEAEFLRVCKRVLSAERRKARRAAVSASEERT